MTKGKVSVVIPAKNEIFLNKTIRDILQKAKGDIEVIAVLDGYWPTGYEVKGIVYNDEMIDDPRVIYIHHGEGRGMRTSINHGASIATGEFLMKSDAHCMYEEGFDLKLKEHIPEYKNDDNNDNWIVIPRRHRLDAENWIIQPQVDDRPPIDYEYLSSPGHYGAKGNKWNERTIERMGKPEFMVDETMTFQGSCYFTTLNHYLNRLGGMNPEGYGEFVREAQELCLKTWLSGGRVYTNKHTWYAHLHKGKVYGRMYFLDARELDSGNAYCDEFWFGNKWKEAKYDLAWLIERFMPVPNWNKELIETVRRK